MDGRHIFLESKYLLHGEEVTKEWKFGQEFFNEDLKFIDVIKRVIQEERTKEIISISPTKLDELKGSLVNFTTKEIIDSLTGKKIIL